jgi:hypothetical protein
MIPFVDVLWFGAIESPTNDKILIYEHDFIIHEVIDYEEASMHTRCVTCDASYCLLCGKMSTKETEYFCHNID